MQVYIAPLKTWLFLLVMIIVAVAAFFLLFDDEDPASNGFSYDEESFDYAVQVQYSTSISAPPAEFDVQLADGMEFVRVHAIVTDVAVDGVLKVDMSESRLISLDVGGIRHLNCAFEAEQVDGLGIGDSCSGDYWFMVPAGSVYGVVVDMNDGKGVSVAEIQSSTEAMP